MPRPRSRHLMPAPTEEPAGLRGRNIITVIGIDEYAHWPRLGNAVSDARGIRKLFVEKLGFLEPLPPLFNADATEETITTLVQDQLRAVLQPDDSLILFFAGHGHTERVQVGDHTVETGYLIPIEARIDHWGDYIKIDSFLEDISKLPARHILLILDACRSGFALGAALQRFRAAVRYEADLNKRVSRKVITSARREQDAADSGPVAGHSLFTGMLVQGLNWGAADLDGNGLVTASELGLFVQQQVGQATASRQTPDFGAFYLDDRGELVISLHDETFDAVKARALTALQQGELTRFKQLVAQIRQLQPDKPETLYLQYRQHLFEGAIEAAIEVMHTLNAQSLAEGVIPLSTFDLLNLDKRLPFWRNVLALPAGSFPVEVTVLAGADVKSIQPLQEQSLADHAVGAKHHLAGYQVERNAILRFRIENLTAAPLFIYLLTIDADGRIDLPPLWEDDEVAFFGLQPGKSYESYPFQMIDKPGLYEARLFATPTRFRYFAAPPAPATRAVMPDAIEPETVAGMTMKAVRYRITPTVSNNLL